MWANGEIKPKLQDITMTELFKAPSHSHPRFPSIGTFYFLFFGFAFALAHRDSHLLLRKTVTNQTCAAMILELAKESGHSTVNVHIDLQGQKEVLL